MTPLLDPASLHALAITLAARIHVLTAGRRPRREPDADDAPPATPDPTLSESSPP